MEEAQMAQYLLSVWHGDLETPSPEAMAQAYHDVDVFNKDISAAGVFVFAGGLHPASTATVVKVQHGEVLTTDGPFAETKEYIGGFWVISAPDFDAALEWGRKATRACALPVEVRPFQDDPEG